MRVNIDAHMYLYLDGFASSWRDHTASASGSPVAIFQSASYDASSSLRRRPPWGIGPEADARTRSRTPPSGVGGVHVPRRGHPRAAAPTRLAGVARSSRAHARRTQPVTYQVRVDLDGAKPPIWRRLLLSSELMLDELHAVLQQAMG